MPMYCQSSLVSKLQWHFIENTNFLIKLYKSGNENNEDDDGEDHVDDYGDDNNDDHDDDTDSDMILIIIIKMIITIEWPLLIGF